MIEPMQLMIKLTFSKAENYIEMSLIFQIITTATTLIT